MRQPNAFLWDGPPLSFWFFAARRHRDEDRQPHLPGDGDHGTLEKAAAIANHASARTTQLYDRRRDDVSLDEVERILI